MLECLREDDGRGGAAMVDLARRLSVVRWFTLPDLPANRVERSVAALTTLAGRLDSAPPARITLLDPAGGRTWIRARDSWSLHAWHRILDQRLTAAREALLPTGRLEHHPLLERSGDSISLRVACLPFAARTLDRRLAGGDPDTLTAELVLRLRSRTLSEIAGMFLWELGRDLLGADPFLPLLDLYEEGFYPLDLGPDEALLWLPRT